MRVLRRPGLSSSMPLYSTATKGGAAGKGGAVPTMNFLLLAPIDRCRTLYYVVCMSKSVSVRLPDRVWEGIEVRRLAEGRSFSQMQVRLLESALELPAATVSENDSSGSGKSPLAEKQAAREGNQRPGGVAGPASAPSTAVDGRSALQRRLDENKGSVDGLGFTKKPKP